MIILFDWHRQLKLMQSYNFKVTIINEVPSIRIKIIRVYIYLNLLHLDG